MSRPVRVGLRMRYLFLRIVEVVGMFRKLSQPFDAKTKSWLLCHIAKTFEFVVNILGLFLRKWSPPLTGILPNIDNPTHSDLFSMSFLCSMRYTCSRNCPLRVMWNQPISSSILPIQSEHYVISASPRYDSRMGLYHVLIHLPQANWVRHHLNLPADLS
jgi:hypothetical protein